MEFPRARKATMSIASDIRITADLLERLLTEECKLGRVVFVTPGGLSMEPLLILCPVAPS